MRRRRRWRHFSSAGRSTSRRLRSGRHASSSRISRNGRKLLLLGFGHSTSFWSDQREAGTHLINAYFDSGRVDDSLYESQSVDFTPEVTQTALGKGIGGAMVGLALLTILSLLRMPLRVHRRGRFGGKASAVLRSLYPAVLGLGGWFIGVLVLITATPRTPLDDELVSTLSVGLPVRLCVYWAWVNSDWTATTRAAGFTAAITASLVGAWLGLHAATDLLALLTAILGATVGANLTLVLLDIAWNRQARDRFAETGPKDVLEARPSTG